MSVRTKRRKCPVFQGFPLISFRRHALSVSQASASVPAAERHALHRRRALAPEVREIDPQRGTRNQAIRVRHFPTGCPNRPCWRKGFGQCGRCRLPHSARPSTLHSFAIGGMPGACTSVGLGSFLEGFFLHTYDGSSVPVAGQGLERSRLVPARWLGLFRLLRLGVEKVVHHRDDDGHALHQRDVGGVGQSRWPIAMRSAASGRRGSLPPLRRNISAMCFEAARHQRRRG